MSVPQNYSDDQKKQSLQLMGIQPWVRRSLLCEQSQSLALDVDEGREASDLQQESTPISAAPEIAAANVSDTLQIRCIEGPDNAEWLICLPSMPTDPRAWRLLDNILKCIDKHRSQIRVVVFDQEGSIQLSVKKLIPIKCRMTWCFGEVCAANILQSAMDVINGQYFSTLELDTLLQQPLLKRNVYKQLLSFAT